MADRVLGVRATGFEAGWFHDERLLRTRPTQRRAFERVDHILDVAGELLDECYPEPVTAELIARRANVRLATFYHYFHGYQAVYGALAARSLERMRAVSQVTTGPLAGRVSLFEMVSAAVDRSLESWSRQPGSKHLLRMSSGMPEFQEKLEAWLEDAITVDRFGVMAKDPGRWLEDKKFVYPTMIRTSLTLTALALATEDPDERARFVAEFKLLVASYLSLYLA